MSEPIASFDKSMFVRHVAFGGMALLWTLIDLVVLKFLLWLDFSLQWAVIYVVLFDINLVLARIDDLREAVRARQ